jgi:hypothetical protein
MPRIGMCPGERLEDTGGTNAGRNRFPRPPGSSVMGERHENGHFCNRVRLGNSPCGSGLSWRRIESNR